MQRQQSVLVVCAFLLVHSLAGCGDIGGSSLGSIDNTSDSNSEEYQTLNYQCATEDMLPSSHITRSIAGGRQVATKGIARMVTILMNFQDAKASDMFTKATMSKTLSEVRAYYNTESKGQFKINNDLNGDTVDDIYTVNIAANIGGGCFNVPMDFDGWTKQAITALTALGVDVNGVHLYMQLPQIKTCPYFWGMGSVDGRWMWLNYPLTSILAHEFGHNLGMNHANTDPENDNTSKEYGDASDIMGQGNLISFNAVNLNYLGWMSNCPNCIKPLANDTSMTLSPIKLALENTHQVIAVFDDATNTDKQYFLSNRAKTYEDFGSRFANGISVHYGFRSRSGSRYIGTLTPGVAFTIPNTSFVVKHVSNGTEPGDVVVSRGTPTTPPPPPPPLVTWPVDCTNTTHRNNTPFAGGDGSTTMPYVICTPTQWNAIAANSATFTKTFMLGNSINFSGSAVTPIGTTTLPFGGILNGNNYTLSNINILSTNTNAVGLFANTSNALLNGFTLDNLIITGNGIATGGVIGTGINTTIQHVRITQARITGDVVVGGIAGTLNNSILSESTLSGTLYHGGTANGVGGMIGVMTGGILSNCAVNPLTISTTTVNPSGISNVGGLVGMVTAHADINNAYARGAITYSATAIVSNIGGLVGLLQDSRLADVFAYMKMTMPLNPSIGGAVGAVAGTITKTGIRWNMAYSRVSTSAIGANATTRHIISATYWRNNVGYDTTLWDLRDGMLPRLFIEN